MSGSVDGAMARAVDRHRELWGEPAFVARAPGRVNLIGEHTDYNDGFVLPMALPFDTAIACSGAPVGGVAEIDSEGYGRAELRPLGGADSDEEWAAHVRGVDLLLRESGIADTPWRGAIATDVPIGASLSSSAAVEVAAARAILHLVGEQWSPVRIAELARRVENELLGLPSGIMDQLISAGAMAGHVSLIDCRSLEVAPHRLPDAVVIAVMDSKTRRQLVDSEFAERRATCSRVAELLGVASLRDATLDDLERLPADATVERRRGRHVISENRRTLDAAAAMSEGDAVGLGRLIDRSHESLRDDYEVSSDALDSIVAAARDSPGCLGARMTGGGFAGCAVALVDADRIDGFTISVTRRYRAAARLEPTVWICEPARGASIEPVPP